MSQEPKLSAKKPVPAASAVDAAVEAAVGGGAGAGASSGSGSEAEKPSAKAKGISRCYVFACSSVFGVIGFFLVPFVLKPIYVIIFHSCLYSCRKTPGA